MSTVQPIGVNSVQKFFDEVEAELVSLQSFDTFEMLREIIEYSKVLGEFAADLMTEDNLVHGCQSTVYIYAERDGDAVVFKAYSDAQVLRGYLGILLQGLNGMQCEDFLHHAKGIVEGFAKRTNIAASVTPTRANAFGNIIELMEKKVNEL